MTSEDSGLKNIINNYTLIARKKIMTNGALFESRLLSDFLIEIKNCTEPSQLVELINTLDTRAAMQVSGLFDKAFLAGVRRHGEVAKVSSFIRNTSFPREECEYEEINNMLNNTNNRGE